MDAVDIGLLRAAQDGLPVCKRPFEVIGRRVGLCEEEVLERLKRLVEQGYVRRVGASIAHYHLGISANAMCAWNVEDGKVEEAVKELVAEREVSHCYQRERARGWDYNLYTMVHARTREECLAMVHSLEERIGVHDYIVLFSTREFKKTGVRI